MQGIGWVSYFWMHQLTYAEEGNRAPQHAASILTWLVVQNMPTIVHKMAREKIWITLSKLSLPPAKQFKHTMHLPVTIWQHPKHAWLSVRWLMYVIFNSSNQNRYYCPYFTEKDIDTSERLSVLSKTTWLLGVGPRFDSKGLTSKSLVIIRITASLKIEVVAHFCHHRSTC